MTDCTRCQKPFANAHDHNSHLRSAKHIKHSSKAIPQWCYLLLTVILDVQAFKKLQTSHKACVHFRCCNCEKDFSCEKALKQHLKSKLHLEPASLSQKSKRSIPCELCSKKFSSEKAKLAHLHSFAHRPVCASLRCLGSGGCKKSFRSPSTMVAHLESGSCKSGITRQDVERMVTMQDTSNLICEQSHCDDSSSSESWEILTPSRTLSYTSDQRQMTLGMN